MEKGIYIYTLYKKVVGLKGHWTHGDSGGG